ncbi:hypothetical protein Nepgr_010515 [Nepenthes gracilis]|uniref:Uncharacterized protein n=1 Tax=Nepenthes gracilis TaxID=150966 RepID=A0AAD3SCJ3_NEPGR|nr:hypothetical protein Nepgr_010515 [Nepenthes gracilis]
MQWSPWNSMQKAQQASLDHLNHSQIISVMLPTTLSANRGRSWFVPPTKGRERNISFHNGTNSEWLIVDYSLLLAEVAGHLDMSLSELMTPRLQGHAYFYMRFSCCDLDANVILRERMTLLQLPATVTLDKPIESLL